MKQIFLIHERASVAKFTPMTVLANAKLTLHAAWSTRGGATKPIYRSPSGDLWVTTLDWPESEVYNFSGLLGAEVTTVELPDEEADAVIAQLNRNLIRPS